MLVDLVKKLIETLSGKKTYLAAALTFGLAVYQFAVLKDPMAAYESFTAALALLGVRAAIAKNGVGA